LTNNNLSIVSKRVFDAFPNLVDLDVSGNSLAGVHFLEPLRQLQVLRMARNKLRALEGDGRFPELMKLDLEGNELQKVSLVGKIFPNLVEIDLRNNRIQSEKELEFVGECPLLTTIDTRGNPVWSEQLSVRLLELNVDINEVDGEELSSGNTQFQARLASIGDIEDPEALFLEHTEAKVDRLNQELDRETMVVNRLASQKASLDMRFREIGKRLESDISAMEENLTRKKHEADMESRNCEEFLQKIYKIAPKPRPQSTLLIENSSYLSNEPSLRPQTVNSDLAPADADVTKIVTTSTLNSLEQSKERNFRLKKLKQAVTFHRAPNPRQLQQQTAQLKALFSAK